MATRMVNSVGDVRLFNVTFRLGGLVIGRVQVIAPSRASALDVATRWRDSDASRADWVLDPADVKIGGTWVAGRPHLGAFPVYTDEDRVQVTSIPL